MDIIALLKVDHKKVEKKPPKVSPSRTKKARPLTRPRLVALYDAKTMTPDEIVEHLRKIMSKEPPGIR
jgi:hypothetical protein